MSSQTGKPFDWTFDPETEDPTLHMKGRKFFFFVAIFSIIVLFTAIFLCARWIFRNRVLLATNATPLQTLPNSSRSEGLDADAIKKLPIILHQTDSSNRALEETECCICLSAFRDGEKLKVLPVCNHCFHCECVDSWLANRSSCPLCRASLKTDSSFPKILIQEPPIIYNYPL
ncbi:unnamed protein product [Lathyrus sativus]|nr:unnamed protein product [Lathyrus sativus]